MTPEDLNRRFADLTVLELQDLLIALEDDENTKPCPAPEDIDLATTVGQLTVKQFIAASKFSLPRGLPNP